MSDRAEFFVRGEPLDGPPLHYGASGLDYVYLLNGFTVEDDPDYGRLVSIDDVDDLHRTIGSHIIRQKREMTGPEFRFLRKQMGFTQEEYALKFGTDVQTIANYEKGKTIPGPSQYLTRTLFALWLMPPDARAGVMREMAETMQQHERGHQRLGSARGRKICSPRVRQWQEGRGICHV
jgi:putative transcriptional regulator